MRRHSAACAHARALDVQVRGIQPPFRDRRPPWRRNLWPRALRRKATIRVCESALTQRERRTSLCARDLCEKTACAAADRPGSLRGKTMMAACSDGDVDGRPHTGSPGALAARWHRPRRLHSSDGGGGASSGGGQSPDPVVLDFPIAYVKRPVPAGRRAGRRRARTARLPAGRGPVPARPCLALVGRAQHHRRDHAGPRRRPRRRAVLRRHAGWCLRCASRTSRAPRPRTSRPGTSGNTTSTTAAAAAR